MSAEQQVNLTDLEPIQLQEVKKQLDSVRLPFDMIYDPAATVAISQGDCSVGRSAHAHGTSSRRGGCSSSLGTRPLILPDGCDSKAISACRRTGTGSRTAGLSQSHKTAGPNKPTHQMD